MSKIPTSTGTPGQKATAFDLLSAALDAHGFICIVGIRTATKQFKKQEFFARAHLANAVEVAQILDAQGIDAYWGTSTFETKDSRLAANVHAVKVLKLDLDVGPKKSNYSGKREAVKALLTFCTQTGLPIPTLVDSGGGVHVYWVLSKALPAADAKLVAEQLKTVVHFNGLKTDPTCTADLSRILRVPGTQNYKTPNHPRDVKLKSDSVVLHDTDTIVELIKAAFNTTGQEIPKVANNVIPLLGALPLHLHDIELDDTTRSLIAGKPQNFETILGKSLAGTGCNQIKYIHNNQTQPNAVEEPRWRAGLSITQFCTDRGEAIHAISRGYPGYSSAETDRKASEIKGPYTYSTFRHNWPKECEGCPFTGKITSPIQLGANDAATTATVPTIWAPPDPLPDQLLPVTPFDVSLLPAVLQPWARDIVERMQCPADFVGITIISALGTVIGRRVGIRPKTLDDWTEYCNFWTCTVGRPGVMKSPAMAAALAPLNALGTKASQRHADQQATFDADAQLQAMRRDAQKKQLAKALAKDPHASIQMDAITGSEAPILKRYLVNDATVEALLNICIENPQGVCAYRDELVALLKSLEREGQESARGFYLTGWNGNSNYTADRISRGRNMHSEAVCLSVLGSTQPGRIGEYLRTAAGGGAGDDGLMQRFSLLVWPDASGTWRNVDRKPNSAAKKSAFDVFEKLDAADPVADWHAQPVLGYDGQPEDGVPPYLRLDDTAAATFLQWRTAFENELQRGDLPPALESHFSKYRKLVPSLALVCHLADGGVGPVSDKAMQRALAWATYLRSHAERAYSAVTQADIGSAKTLLKRIRSGDGLDGFTARDIYRNGWSGLANAAEVARALTALIEYGWLRSVTQPTDGRTKTLYYVHPSALPKSEADAWRSDDF
jgi:hypothetical protein